VQAVLARSVIAQSEPGWGTTAKSEALTPVMELEVMLTPAEVPLVTVTVWVGWAKLSTAGAKVTAEGETTKGEVARRRTERSGGMTGWVG